MQRNYWEEKFLYLLGYRSAASRGDCYYQGHYVTKNIALARQYYRVATERDEIYMGFIGLRRIALYEGNTMEAEYYYARAFGDRPGSSVGIEQYEKVVALYQEMIDAERKQRVIAYIPYAIDAMLRLARIYQQRASSPYYALHFDKTDSKKKSLYWYKRAAILYDKEAIAFFTEESKKDADVAFAWGEAFAKGEIGGKINLAKALQYYFLAAEKKHHDAIFTMERLESNWDEDTRFNMAKLYIADHGLERALPHLILLADRAYLSAIDELEKIAKQKAVNAILIGQRYEAQQSAAAYKKATEFYFYACRQGDPNALALLEISPEQLSDEAKLELGRLYRDCFNREQDALICFKRLADKKVLLAQKELDELADKSADHTFTLAEMYAHDGKTELADRLYINAALRNHRGALHYINKVRLFANAGDQTWQYKLGAYYHYPRREMQSAIGYCIQSAEQGYLPAMQFLLNTSFTAEQNFMIAQKYEAGDEGIDVNLMLAARFYQKSAAGGHVQATFNFGLLLLNTENSKSDAFDCFIAAAKLGHPEALPILEGLGHEVDPTLQLKLGDLYQHLSPPNEYRAEYWYQEAAEGECHEAKQYLCTRPQLR
jgi:TPR repeat protein